MSGPSARSVLPALFLLVSCVRSGPSPVLLFSGKGTSPADVEALARVLEASGVEFRRVDSSAIESLDAEQLRAWRLLVVPGGNFVEMSRALSPAAAARIRSAVESGTNYFGICGGAFLAGSSPPGSQGPEPHFAGLDLARGIAFPFYEASARGIRKAPVWVQTAEGPALQQYWEDGPALIGWGAVVGTYPDGTPAIVEGNVGSGRVLLCGVHPEAPDSWRTGMSFATPARADNDFAASLVRALLEGQPLAHF